MIFQSPEIQEIPTLEQIEASPTRCPHTETAEKMENRILEAKKLEIPLVELLFAA